MLSGAIIGAIFVTLSVFSFYINSDVFYTWLTQDLLPKISKDVVIVMDNASFHKTEDMLMLLISMDAHWSFYRHTTLT